MIIIIKEVYGDYEDHYEKVVALLDVDTNKSEAELANEHTLFKVAIMKANNIDTYEDKYGFQPHALVGKPKAGVKKLHKKLLMENDFLTWIKNTYKYKQIDNFIEMVN